MIYRLLIILTLFMINSCTVTSVNDLNLSSEDHNSPGKKGKIIIYNGTALAEHNITDTTDSLQHDISNGLYGALFVMKEGYQPNVRIFSSTERPVDNNSLTLTEMPDSSLGIITGVVCSAVSGGKIKEQRGIAKLYKDVNIQLHNDSRSYSATTDANGIFMITLPSGDYRISSDNRDYGKVFLRPGLTEIRNILKGIRLVD